MHSMVQHARICQNSHILKPCTISFVDIPDVLNFISHRCLTTNCLVEYYHTLKYCYYYYYYYYFCIFATLPYFYFIFIRAPQCSVQSFLNNERMYSISILCARDLLKFKSKLNCDVQNVNCRVRQLRKYFFFTLHGIEKFSYYFLLVA